jgi:DNA-binding NarL/FixJ family response regulator
MPIKLTKKQLVVVRKKANGLPCAAIAKELEVSIKTVDAHLCEAMKRCECKTWSELIDWYFCRNDRVNTYSTKQKSL